MSNLYYVNQFINMSADTFMQLFGRIMMPIEDTRHINPDDNELSCLVSATRGMALRTCFDSNCYEQWFSDTTFKVNDIQSKYHDYITHALKVHNNKNASKAKSNISIVDDNCQKILELCKKYYKISDVEHDREKFIAYTDIVNNTVATELYPDESLGKFITRLDLFNNVEYIKGTLQQAIDDAEAQAKRMSAAYEKLTDKALIESYLDCEAYNGIFDPPDASLGKIIYVCVISSEELSDMYNVWATHFNIPVRKLSRVDYYIASLLSHNIISETTLISQLSRQSSHNCLKDIIVITIRNGGYDGDYTFVIAE